MAVTVVTGGSRGIGASTCVHLARSGHDVVVGFHHDEAAAVEVARQVRDLGAKAITARVDTASSASVQAMFAAAAALGQVTGLVNNAGIIEGRGNLVDVAEADIRRVIEVNVLGAIFCAQEAIRVMTAGGGGSIVNVSSGAATLGGPGEYVHYAMSKGALDTLTVGLSKELGAAGIRVNTVSPGVIRTDIHAPGRLERVGPLAPMGRAGEPDEVAAAIVWLLSDEASYVTGANLRVAGGR
ncbi:oxidoreductase [Rhizocola hellebori]|uniref:Oxidoreductase n=1 Tax=Rhizocola hellebori TaxID=1392758 RepID=A0A8J3Q6L6_9ACTN|nr:SDR family oxidoreductase [Rhizocola hellebori]GIH04100.1 oxidoreductase [Rhizocola hellebori]